MNDEDKKGLEKWQTMVMFQIKRLEKLLENELEEARRDILLERKRRLEHELKIALLSDRNYRVLLKIQKNKEEYEKLIERKEKGEYVDDLIKQNRYTAEMLTDQDKKNCEESIKEFEAEKKRIGKERPEWPVIEAAGRIRPLEHLQELPEAKEMTLENLGVEMKNFYDNYKNMVMLQIQNLESLIPKTTDESRRSILIQKLQNLEQELTIVSWTLIYFSNKNKPHVNTSLSKEQEKEAQKLVDLVVKGLKLNKEPRYKSFGLNHAELERRGKHFYDRDIKLVFNLENHIKRLVYNFEIKPTSKFYAEQHLWTGVLEVSIPQGFLFGRVATQIQHGGGTYCFAPFNHDILKIEGFKEEWLEMRRIIEEYTKTEMVKDFFSEEIKEFNNLYDSIENTIENYFVIATLNQFRFSSKAITFMKEGYDKFKSRTALDDLFISQLNEDLKLIKLLKKISHFGNSSIYSFKFISECDISIIFFPHQYKTIFQVCDFKSQNKSTFPALNALITKLIDISKNLK
ncbi:MAG: hypothetical protein ACFFAI_11915 [Promethearchaeota archaeon]